MSDRSNILQLRELLSRRFPHAHGVRPPGQARTLPTGIGSLDDALGGGWPVGELSELLAVGDGSGSAQALHAFVRTSADSGQFLALVDGADSFDVDAVEPAHLARLLWVRCDRADTALKAADILLRDRNVPTVVVDLKLNPAAQLRKISASLWHRFRRLMEGNGTTVIIVTPTPLVSGAACRVRMENELDALTHREMPGTVAAQLRFTVERGSETARLARAS